MYNVKRYKKTKGERKGTYEKLKKRLTREVRLDELYEELEILNKERNSLDEELRYTNDDDTYDDIVAEIADFDKQIADLEVEIAEIEDEDQSEGENVRGENRELTLGDLKGSIRDIELDYIDNDEVYFTVTYVDYETDQKKQGSFFVKHNDFQLSYF